MRLINKYETSMRGGRAHYRSAVGAGELAVTGVGTRNQSRSWTPLGYMAGGIGRAAKITQEINIQVGHSERGLRHSQNENVLERLWMPSVWRGVLHSRLDCP